MFIILNYLKIVIIFLYTFCVLVNFLYNCRNCVFVLCYKYMYVVVVVFLWQPSSVHLSVFDKNMAIMLIFTKYIIWNWICTEPSLTKPFRDGPQLVPFKIVSGSQCCSRKYFFKWPKLLHFQLKKGNHLHHMYYKMWVVLYTCSHWQSNGFTVLQPDQLTTL